MVLIKITSIYIKILYHAFRDHIKYQAGGDEK
jgi:hypothetical protein